MKNPYLRIKKVRTLENHELFYCAIELGTDNNP